MVLWTVHEVPDGSSEGDLAHRYRCGPDRRVFLTEAECRAGIEEQVRAEWTEWRNDELAGESESARREGREPEDLAIPPGPPALEWAPVPHEDDMWAGSLQWSLPSHMTLRLVVEELGAAFYAVPVRLVRRG